MTTTYEQFEEGFLKQAAEQGADVNVLRGMIAEQAELMQKWSMAFDEIEQQTGDRLFRYKLAGELAELYADNARQVKEANADIWPMIQQWLSDPANQKLLMGAGGGGLLGMLLGGNNKALGGLLGGLGGAGAMYGWNNGWFDNLFGGKSPAQPAPGAAPAGPADPAQAPMAVPAQPLDLAGEMDKRNLPGMRDSDISNEMASRQSYGDALKRIQLGLHAEQGNLPAPKDPNQPALFDTEATGDNMVEFYGGRVVEPPGLNKPVAPRPPSMSRENYGKALNNQMQLGGKPAPVVPPAAPEQPPVQLPPNIGKPIPTRQPVQPLR